MEDVVAVQVTMIDALGVQMRTGAGNSLGKTQKHRQAELSVGAVDVTGAGFKAGWMIREAPSPNICPSDSCCQSMLAMGCVASAVASACAQSGLPAKASHAKLGIFNNQPGSSVSWLAAMRSSSRLWQFAKLAGSSRRRLPASINFCSCRHRDR